MTSTPPSTERRNELLSEIIRIQGYVNDGVEPSRLFEPMLDVLVEYSESEFGFIGEVFHDDNGNPWLQTHAITNIAWDEATQRIYEENARTGFEFRNLESLFGRVLQSGKALISNSPATDNRAGGIPDGHPPLRSFMGLPFYRGDRMVGMVGVANRQGGYDNTIQEALAPVLSGCSFIIETFRLARERQLFAAQLKDSEALHRGILEAAVDSIITVDDGGMIVSVNRAVIRMFGYEPAELVGQSMSMLMPDRFVANHHRYIEKYLETRQTGIVGVGREIVGRHKCGTEIPLELAVSEVRQGDRILFTGILRDITDRKRAEKERSDAYAQLVAVLDSCSQVSVVATDTQGVITVFNRGAENMLGYSTAEMVGKQTPAILHDPEEVAAYGKVLTERYGTEVSGFRVFVEPAERNDFDRREWTYIHADGRRIRADLTVTAVRDSQGHITGYLGVAVDVTARHQAELQLIEAKETAEAASKAKSDFLANTSHEIRTPINGIIGMQELLRQTQLTDEQSQYIDALGNCARVLLNVINEVLDYSKIEAGHLKIEHVPVELRGQVTNSLEPLQIRARQKGLRFTIELDQDVPTHVLTDPIRLTQILMNLVGNAVKFTSHGSIRVSVGIDYDESGLAILRFAVSDTGPGIEPAVQEAIFDPFTQSDSSTTRRFGGTGLGLSIASRLVELLGGDIQLESEPGSGTTFRFSVRTQITDAAPPESDSTDQNQPEPSDARDDTPGLKVLVAEDHPVNQLFASRILQRRQHDVTIATNGQEAVDHVHQQDFDVVLMDVQMPIMDGLEAIARIRQKEKGTGRRLPIIALTAHAMNGYDQKCYAAGADAYISKPLRPQDLFDTIEKLVQQRIPAVTANHSPEMEPVMTDTQPTSSAAISRATILENTGDDIELAEELIEIFQDDLPQTLQQLVDAIGEEDLDTVARLAHSLKSPLTMFGADTGKEQSHQLELAARDGQSESMQTEFQNLRTTLTMVSDELSGLKL